MGLPARFIVSTGRSGSTLLSRMVAENRKILVLSEFLASVDNGTRFRRDAVDGTGFLEALSADDDLSALIALHGRQSEEILNPGGGHTATATGRAPSLVRVTLPALTDDPEGLFEEIAGFVRRQPIRAMADHYTALFEWLCARLGRECWVERSGMSIRIFPELRETFPDARFLHLHRDGLETALSMHAHPWFRVGVWFDRDPLTRAEALAAIRSAGRDDADAIARLYSDPPSVAPYGAHWSDYMALAYRDFAKVPPENYRELAFEDLTAAAETSLAMLAEFFELPDDPGWIDRAARLVNGAVRVRAPELPAGEFTALSSACRAGQILTGRAQAGGLNEVMATLRSAWLEIGRRPGTSET
jgi:LPS sulfotransferase NodH